MLQKHSHSHNQVVFRVVLASLLAFVLGVSLGLRDAKAETVSNIYVPNAGNVGTANTAGWETQGIRYAVGSTGSSVTMYYLYAGMRLWHFGNLEEESYAGSYYSTITSTATLDTVLFGEPFSTRSTLQYSSSSHSALRYTSYYNYSGSCSNYWYYDIDC